MPDLVDRLMGVDIDPEDPQTSNIPVHAFCSVVAEYMRGGITGAQAVALWNMTSQQVNQAQAVIDRVESGDLTRELLKDVLYLATLRTYDRAKVLSRLGF
jgi:hypothetical protein